MLNRLADREEALRNRLDKLKRLIRLGKLGGEENRIWLDTFANGTGLDICCGDFPVRGATGVDANPEKLGAAYFGNGDELYHIDTETQDFIVTNYIDALPSVLGALFEWHRVLKPGGVLAFTCCNVDAYPDDLGPLQNHNRLHAFNGKGIRAYLARANYVDIEVTEFQQFLRVTARKPA